MTEQKQQKQQTIRNDVIILCLIAVFLVLSIYSMNYFGPQDKNKFEVISGQQGGVFGPFKVESDRMLTLIRISRMEYFDGNGWDALDLEFLDTNQQYVGGFGAELWLEQGYDDDDYRWQAHDYGAEMDYMFDLSGDYYVKVTVKSSHKSQQSGDLYHIVLYPQRGSTEFFGRFSVLLFVMLLLYIFFVCNHFAQRH